MDSLIASRICGGNTAYKRNESDFYPTPPEATIALLDFLKIPKDKKIWEPACGENHMVNAIKEYGYDVVGTDIQTGTDFLTADIPDGIDWIITNPPFSVSESFIERCIWSKKPFALLLKAQYWHAKRRVNLFREHPPKYILPLSWRPDFMMGKRGCGSPLLDVMWCVWETDFLSYPNYIILEKPKK